LDKAVLAIPAWTLAGPRSHGRLPSSSKSALVTAPPRTVPPTVEDEPESAAWIPSPGAEAAGALPGTVNALLDPWPIPPEKADGEPLDQVPVPLPLEADAGAWETPALVPAGGAEDGLLVVVGVKESGTGPSGDEDVVVPDVGVGVDGVVCAAVGMVLPPNETGSGGKPPATEGRLICSPRREGT